MKKILIVDDEKSSRTILQSMVQSLGYISVLSSGATHALETLKCNDDIEMIVTDMSMPKKDGRWLIKKVLSTKDLKDIPVIIMSGAIGIKDVADLLDAGAKAFIPKPVTKDDIKEYIERHIQ